MPIDLNYIIYYVDVAFWFKSWSIQKTKKQTLHFSVDYTKGFLDIVKILYKTLKTYFMFWFCKNGRNKRECTKDGRRYN